MSTDKFRVANKKNRSSVINNTGTSSGTIPARVLSVNTDTADLDNFLRITYTDPTNPTNNSKGTATPLDTRNQTVPVPGEVVLIHQTPSGDQTEYGQVPGVRYSNLSLWNHPHHSAYFFHNRELQSDFKEQQTINPLQLFLGDTVMQGRLTQTLHFSSVQKNTPWKGNLGTPIIILSNGQIETEEGSTAIPEDINQDYSSIYLTSPSQVVELELAPHITFTSNPEEPKFREEFNDSQVIINGDRLHLNSKRESILLTSSKYINLGGTYLNLEASKNINLHATKIYLHNDSRTEAQPAALGQSLVDELQDLYNYLEDVAEQLGQAGIALTAIGVPNGGMITQTSISLKAFITGSRTTLKKRLLSDKVYLPTKSL